MYYCTLSSTTTLVLIISVLVGPLSLLILSILSPPRQPSLLFQFILSPVRHPSLLTKRICSPQKTTIIAVPVYSLFSKTSHDCCSSVLSLQDRHQRCCNKQISYTEFISQSVQYLKKKTLASMIIVLQNVYINCSFQVKKCTFYDVFLDFILLDAFDDLENPPKSVVAVVQNQWLSNGFKETVRPLMYHAHYTACLFLMYDDRHAT